MNRTRFVGRGAFIELSKEQMSILRANTFKYFIRDTKTKPIQVAFFIYTRRPFPPALLHSLLYVAVCTRYTFCCLCSIFYEMQFVSIITANPFRIGSQAEVEQEPTIISHFFRSLSFVRENKVISSSLEKFAELLDLISHISQTCYKVSQLATQLKFVPF